MSEITLNEYIETVQWFFVAGASIAVGYHLGVGTCRLLASVIRRAKR